MLVASFFSWWYGRGWAQVGRSLVSRINAAMEMFSVAQLLRTLFAPWRRIISYPGASLADKWRASMDNLFSRVIGFVVRIFVLLAAMVAVAVVVALTLVEIIIWPLLPMLIPGGVILGLVT